MPDLPDTTPRSPAGRKLVKLPKKAKRDPNKSYYVVADKRPHSERFGVTVERLTAIVERMKNGA